MKRMVKALFPLLILSMLAGCIKSFSIENPAKVTVQRADKVVEATDAETVRTLTEDITSKEFKRGKSSKHMTGWDYWLKWYDEDGEVIFEAFVSPNSIDYRDRFWICEDETIDTGYYDKLIEAAK